MCNSCQVRGAIADGVEEALVGFHPIHELTHILCEQCFHNEVPSPVVRDLINDMTLRLGAEGIDLRPGSVLRALVETSAHVLDGLNIWSVDLATEQVVGELQTQLGSELDLSPGTHTHNLVNQVVQSAVAERQAMLSGLVGSYITTNEGRSQLARAMVQPIRDRISFGGLARSAFTVEPLPAGASPIYDRDPGVAAMVVPEPVPDWAFVGAWVRPVLKVEFGLTVCRIVEVADDFALLQGLNATVQVNRTEGKMLKDWEPCEAPAPGPTRYERLSQGAELI